MPANLTPEEWQKLQERGDITPETYGMVQQGFEPVPSIAPQPEPQTQDIPTFDLQPSPQPNPQMQPASYEPDNTQLTTDQVGKDTGLPEDLKPALSLRNVDAIQQGYDMQQHAAVNAYDAGQQKAAAEAGYLDQVTKENQRMLERQQADQLKRDQAVQAATAKLEQMNQDYGNLQVDPKRLYKNASTGDKVLAAISLFLGSFDMKGNQAAGIIQKAITQDIDLQKADIEKKGEGLKNQAGILSNIRQQFKDQATAQEAARVAYLNNAQLKLQSISSKYTAPELKAKAEMLYGQLEVQKQDAMRKVLESEQTAALTRSAAFDPTKVDPNALPEKLRERFVPGYGFATTQTNAKDATNKLTSLDNLTSLVDRMIALRNDHGAEFLNRKAVAEGENIATQALLGLKEAATLGALDKGAVEVGQKIIPSDPLSVGFVGTQLQAYKKTLADQKARLLKAYNLTDPVAQEQEKRKALGLGAPVGMSK